MVPRMIQNDSRLMIRTRGRILGPSALALAVAAGLAGPALAQTAPAAAPAAAPQDPQVLTAAGRLARAQGKTTQAGQFFAAAITAEERQRAVQLAASRPAGSSLAARNPFAARTANQPMVQSPAAWGQTAAPYPVNYLPAMQTMPAAGMAVPALYIPNVAGAARFPAAPPGAAPERPWACRSIRT